MNNNLTIVTGFFDIGRDSWKTKHARSLQDYMKYIKNVMSLNNYMVIFCEPHYLETFQQFRENKPSHFITKLVTDLEMYKHLDKIIYCKNNPPIDNHPDKLCPEYSEPLYNVVVNSKSLLLNEAATANPFNTEFFCWLDAGYTHSSLDFSGVTYNPTILYNYPYTITVSQLIPLRFILNKGYLEFYSQHIDVVSGGFIFGTKCSILDYHQKYIAMYEKLLYNYNISDDDQYYITMMLLEYPSLFNPISMNWFGSMDLK